MDKRAMARNRAAGRGKGLVQGRGIEKNLVVHVFFLVVVVVAVAF